METTIDFELPETFLHTKAPWTVPHFACDDTPCNCVSVLAEPYMGSVCQVSVDNGIGSVADGANDSPPLEEAKANARLIAAAPDLFAACVEFIHKVDRGEARSTRSYAQMKAAVGLALGISAA